MQDPLTGILLPSLYVTESFFSLMYFFSCHVQFILVRFFWQPGYSENMGRIHNKDIKVFKWQDAGNTFPLTNIYPDITGTPETLKLGILSLLFWLTFNIAAECFFL